MQKNIQLFITCIIDTLYPEIGRSVVNVLNKVGVEVEFPDKQTCCGQPAFNAGMWHDARKIAMHTIQVFEKTKGYIVIPSGSCCAMIRHSYQELFDGDDSWSSRAKSMADRCFEFTEFLVDILGVHELGATYPGKITYHSSCHLLRELGVKQQPLILLNSIKQAELIELPGSEECCGFGGVFSVEHPEISTEMLNRKVLNIASSGAPVVISCDAGCMTNINGGLNRKNMPQRVLHIAQILDTNKNNILNSIKSSYGK